MPKTHELGKLIPFEKKSNLAKAQGKMCLRHMSLKNLTCTKINLLQWKLGKNALVMRELGKPDLRKEKFIWRRHRAKYG